MKGSEIVVAAGDADPGRDCVIGLSEIVFAQRIDPQIRIVEGRREGTPDLG
jgi:hypothetical protein